VNDQAERVSVLRGRVEEQERELDSAVHDLKVAARRMVEPGEWFRRNPMPLLAGALALGWWLGSRGNNKQYGRRHR
jgi:hypothetical protein